MSVLPISCQVNSLAMEHSYDYLGSSEVTLMNMA